MSGHPPSLAESDDALIRANREVIMQARELKRLVNSLDVREVGRRAEHLADILSMHLDRLINDARLVMEERFHGRL